MSEKISCPAACPARAVTETSASLSSIGAIPSSATRNSVPTSGEKVSGCNVSMFMSPGFLAGITNIFERLRSESLGQLGKVKTSRRHRLTWRIEYSLGQFRFRIERTRRRRALAHATDRPIAGPRRLLNQKGFGRAIPGDSPGQSPAVPRSHRTAIFEINAAGRRSTVVEQQPCGPALVSFDVAVAGEIAIEQNNRAGVAAARGDKPDVVAGHRAAIQKNLIAIRRKLGRLR